MSNFNITSRYAKALLDDSEEKALLPKVHEDVNLLLNTLSQSVELKRFLKSPVIKQEKKKEILLEIFSERICAETKNFIEFLVSKKREDLIEEIFIRFIEVYNEKHGIVVAEVTSAQELSDAQKKELIQKLEKRTAKKVELKYKIDESIIGGFVIKIGDTLINGSAKHQLTLLKKKFLEEELVLN
ncbi:MAG: ATP synthase F1 subunit delta [Bacteroidetes bacterium]|nr:ATP synthase F1 subunit delta [Bacteroidota bacterium]MBU1679368.1 ATP synthase F1 subunit delta [Bacteroidota bacterium]MBU2507620.1 ATP synthase F1 subunit delta [Bacteroidota bacterium]